jgi:hypothetical protein
MAPKPNTSYFKFILTKVQRYPALFQKEMKKARACLTRREYNSLMVWVRAKFNKSTLTLD